MSCVRYFNSTPHVVRYGMQDDEKEEGWMIFWRNGVKFQITVSRSDVLGTRFEKKWTDLNQTFARDPNFRRDWSHRWEMLCDCIISQCLDLLEELAPDGHPYWTTLRDYVHTPGYEVKVVADEQLGDAAGEVVRGPEVEGAYELAPLPLDEVAIDTAGLPRYQSKDLRVVDREVDWRAPPHRVQTNDSRHFALENIETYARRADTDKIENHSLDRIRAYMKIREHCRNQPGGVPDRMAQVLGYVTDETIPSEKRARRGASSNSEVSNDPPDPQYLIAGIVLTDFPHFRTIGDIVRDAREDSNLLSSIYENKEAWRAQTLAIVNDIHARGMACGGHEETNWPGINQWAVHIDNQPAVWLDPLIRYFVAPDTVSQAPEDLTSDFGMAKDTDLRGAKRIFDEWLPEELAKIEDSASKAGES